jgi:transposase
MRNLAKVFVGVDVSKKFLDIYMLPVEKSMRIDNTKQGYQKFLKELETYDVEHIVFESTGGYEKPFVKTLKAAHYNTWIVDPKRIKAFIVSEGVKAKTDKIDAKMIARFAVEKRSVYQSPIRSIGEEELRSLVKRRDDLVQMITSEKLRLDKPDGAFSQKYILKHVAYMQKQVETIGKRIDQVVSNNKTIKDKIEVLESTPGIGKVIAATLVAEMPELGTLERREIAALAGMAPYTKQSGSSIGYAKTLPSRTRVRKILFVAALVASRHNEILKAFYDRLIKAGKKPIVAIVAVARRLIVILNAMVRDGKKWKNKILPVTG